MSPHLRGIWAPVATPLEDDLSPSSRLLAEHVRRLLKEGCHGVVLFGTTGEATSFAVAERRALLDRLLEAGAPPERLIVGAGCCALPDTVELAQHAAATDCAAVLMLPPFFYKSVPEEGLYRLFSETFDRLGAQLPRTLLYHFPKLSQIPIPVSLLDRLAQARPGVVVGIKDSSGDPDSLAAYLRARPDLAVFPGTETLLLEGLRGGAAGAITAGANVNAAAIRAVFDAHEAGDSDAPVRQRGVTAFRLALQRHPMIPAIKRILAERTGERIWANVRPPLLPL
ncbi:MAG: dihydrodipicolinate synthase family protein, partial [Planctomycetota bacterium]